MDPAILVYKNNHLDPPLSHLFAGAICVTFAATIAFCIVEARKARRAAEEAEKAVAPSAPLAPGARFVSGKVELAEGETMAVQVTVTQVGKEVQHKNGKSHRFTETARETRARPFYLRHDSGARIRVEPPKKKVLLVDELDQIEWLEQDQRRRRAELVPGEMAVVEGALGHGDDPEAMRGGGGYRDAPARGWLMKPMANGHMHVSTEGLARRHTLRARAFDRSVLIAIVLAVVAQLPLFTYWARVFLGEDVTASYTGKDSYVTRNSKGQTTTHYVVSFDYWEGQSRSATEDIDSDDYAELGAEGGGIWIRRVPGHPFSRALGRGSSLGVIPWFVAAGLAGFAAFRALQTHRYRRWYEGTVTDDGPGGLPTPPMTRFTAHVSRKKRKKPQGGNPQARMGG